MTALAEQGNDGALRDTFELREARPLCDALDAAVVGHAEAKEGLLLALVAREHALLTGPPGTAKTLLAETLARASGAVCATVRFHRDLREADLLGAPVLRRRALGAGERITRGRRDGALLRAEVAVLDDLDRAPGEALAPLLRLLAERRAGGRALPLESAIATEAPDSRESCADPLEPTQLDRFAVQVRLHGLLLERRFGSARRLVDASLASTEPDAWPPPAAPGARAAARAPAGDPTRRRIGLSDAARRLLQERAARLPVEAAARRGLVRLLARLAALETPVGGAALITDRAFGPLATRVLRAHALLRGAARVATGDLRALRYMIARRIPEDAQPLAAAWIEEAAGERPGRRVAAATARLRPSPPGSGAAQGGAAPVPVERAAAAWAPPRAAEARPGVPDASVDAAPLLRALEGRLQRGRALADEHLGGQPRRYRRLRRLDEIFDADPAELADFVEGRLPAGPRALRRERRDRGGVLVLLRDVSASMEGALSAWAGDVLRALIRIGARRGMRMGYVEFHHEAEAYPAGDRFFHRRYGWLSALAATPRASGRTSFEAPLRLALGELRGRGGRDRHIVLLTDGVPVAGDPGVARERLLARRLGVRVHTLFLGRGACPAVLDALSLETGGLRFAARPENGGRLRVVERDAAAAEARGARPEVGPGAGRGTWARR